jgi:hypothetical protein
MTSGNPLAVRSVARRPPVFAVDRGHGDHFMTSGTSFPARRFVTFGHAHPHRDAFSAIAIGPCSFSSYNDGAGSTWTGNVCSLVVMSSNLDMQVISASSTLNSMRSIRRCAADQVGRLALADKSFGWGFHARLSSVDGVRITP